MILQILFTKIAKTPSKAAATLKIWAVVTTWHVVTTLKDVLSTVKFLSIHHPLWHVINLMKFQFIKLVCDMWHAENFCQAVSAELWSCYMPARELPSTLFSIIPVTSPSPLVTIVLLSYLPIHHCYLPSLRLSFFILFFDAYLFCPYYAPSIIPRFCGWIIIP